MKRRKGFTLIELLVVISIISLLSSVVFSSLSSARVKARDAVRKSDLNQIRTALELYYSTCNTYVVAQNCTGTVYGSNGWGWFNAGWYVGSAGSVGQGLVFNNLVAKEIIDPSGQISGPLAYMIAADKNHYTIWATITSPSAADTDTINNCYFSNYDNYSAPITPAQNYCVSN